MYNFKNTVAAQARITKNIQSLLDVIVINNKKKKHTYPGTVLDLGFSDHETQILWINVEKCKKWSTKSQKRTVH